jgi:hypothetical protein
MKRRYVGNYAREIKVGDAYVQTAPGDFIELDATNEEETENKELIDNGTLIPANGETVKPVPVASSKVEGGDK